MAYLLEDCKNNYKFDITIVNQIQNEFGEGNYEEFELEYDILWDDVLLKTITTESSNENRKLAGAGPVDYNEGKLLYMFIRTRKPQNVLEIGFASGVSSSIIALALEKNGSGKLYIGDLNSNPDHEYIIPLFKKFIKKGIINPTYPIDGVVFVEEFDPNIPIDLTFSDASHEPEFCAHLARSLYEKYPDALHLYHEWSFSPRSSEEAKKYISLKENLKHQAFAEREAFEEMFPKDDYHHYGFYGSCGLGVVKKRLSKKEMKVYYRLSNLEAGISKKKIPNATKKHCLENCIKEFGDKNIVIVGDRLNKETKDYVNSLNLRLVEVDNGSGAGTFRDALDLAIKENTSDDYVYLLEDDFLHLPGSAKLLKEGVDRFGMYTTLYDHPDKYLNADKGGNPQIQMNSEVTRLAKTDSVHWKLTNSTVMSFATRVDRLKDDYELLKKYSNGRITDSYGFFSELIQTKQLGVVSSVPGYSTHCEAAWLTPLVNWEEV